MKQEGIPKAWTAALIAFTIAGGTGALFRWGLLGFPLAGLQPVNIRHAHSHLMYFGWATPALMLLIGTLLARHTGRVGPLFVRFAGIAVAGGLLAYVPFLLFGYSPVRIGNARIPVATIVAALNMLVWYAFILHYLRLTRGISRPLWVRLWDASLVFMVLASLGAWGRALLVAMKVTDPFWENALVHLFLIAFSDGWFVLALLGVLYALLPAEISQTRRAQWATWSVLVGLPLTFLLGVPLELTPPTWRYLAGIAGIMVGLGLLLHLTVLVPQVSPLWRVPLAFLALKAVGEIGVSVPALARWAEANALRIPYLHWLLLGFVTLGLVMAADEVWQLKQRNWLWGWTLSVLAMELSLLPLTGLWPSPWRGMWTMQAAAWGALPVVLVALGHAVHFLWHRPRRSWHLQPLP